MGNAFLLQWEYVARFYPSFVGLLGAILGWVAMLVAETSMMVGLPFDAVDLIEFEHKVGNY